MDLLRLGESLVHRRRDQVFEHFAVAALDESGVDRDPQNLTDAVSLDFDEIRPGATDDAAFFQFFVERLQATPHLLGLLDERT